MNTKRSLAHQLNRTLGPLTFGRFLRGARTAQDRTQVAMAKLLGLSRSTLCGLEKGRQLVSPQLAARIARKCGLSEVVAVETALMDQLRRARLAMSVTVQKDEHPSAPAGPRSRKARPKTPAAAMQKKRRAPLS